MIARVKHIPDLFKKPAVTHRPAFEYAKKASDIDTKIILKNRSDHEKEGIESMLSKQRRSTKPRIMIIMLGVCTRLVRALKQKFLQCF
jgi:hypothetical protein